MISSPNYTPETHPFPNTQRDPAKKDERYHMDYSKAIMGLYQSNGTAWGIDSQDYFKRMRLYGNGQQDTNQYFSFVKNAATTEDPTATSTIWDDNSVTREAKRKGFYATMFKNFSPAPKIASSLHGLLDKTDWDIMCDCEDANSKGLVEQIKFKKFWEAQDADFQVEYKKKAGIPVDEPMNFPRTVEELEIFEAREGFKLSYAKTMQKLLRHTFYASQWDSVTRTKVVEDLKDTRYATVMDYFDSETNTFKVKWLDPAKVVMQYSDEFDYEDSEYCGYFDTITISNLRRERPDLTEDQLVALAKNYKSKFGNPKKWNEEKYSHLDPSTGEFGGDGFKVCVFRAFWIDCDSYKRMKYVGKTGNERILDLGYNSKPKPLTEAQKERGMSMDVYTTDVRIVRQCAWVVDSDICFDWGKYHMAARPAMTKPKLPIHAEQLLQTSITERLEPIYDGIAICWLQFLNDLANMVQRGYAINMGMLMGIAMNGKDLDPASIISMWKEKGLLPYMYNPLNGGYGGGVATPITPIDGGLGKRVEETTMQLQMWYQQIENVTGINPLSLGVSPDKEAPVKTSEAALQATNNVLKPMLHALLEQKESVAKSLSLRIQIGLRVDKDIRKAYAGWVSPGDIKTMLLAEQEGTQYGIKLRARPDEAQRMSVKKYLELEVQRGTLNSPDALYFEERINSGADITEIRQEMSYAIEKNKEQAHRQQIEVTKAQNDGLKELEIIKDQNLAKQKMLEYRSKVGEEQMRGEIKRKEQIREHNAEFFNKVLDAANAENGVMKGGQK